MSPFLALMDSHSAEHQQSKEETAGEREGPWDDSWPVTSREKKVKEPLALLCLDRFQNHPQF